jgi:hypothetical protein
MTVPSLILSRKLGKLIPVLASDKDGEVLAAVRAVSCALASEGLDWHDLSSVISIELAKRQSIASAIAPPVSFDLLSHQERRAWLDALIAVDWLTPFERSRVGDVLNRVKTGMDFFIHHKTRRMIDALIARAEAKGVRA